MMRPNKIDLIIAAGAINAFIAVAAGAFAAHGLKNVLSSDYLAVFRTAADYQMMHGIGLVLIGVLTKQNANVRNMTAALFMLGGIILFSGSLYILATTGLRWLGMITPFGGVCFLIAWLILAFNYLKNTTGEEKND